MSNFGWNWTTIINKIFFLFHFYIYILLLWSADWQRNKKFPFLSKIDSPHCWGELCFPSESFQKIVSVSATRMVARENSSISCIDANDSTKNRESLIEDGEKCVHVYVHWGSLVLITLRWTANISHHQISFFGQNNISSQ